MFHRGPLQAVEGISRFAKLNRGALEQLKFVALSQMRSIKVRLRPRKLKMDLGGETSAGHFEHLSFFSREFSGRMGRIWSVPHRPSRRVIVDSSPAGSMGVDGLWICWIRLAVLHFFAWFSGK